MTEGAEFSFRTARVMHGALTAGVFVIVLVLAAVRTAVPIPPITELRAVVRVVGIGLFIAAVGVGAALRSGLPPIPAQGSRDAWWAAHGRRAMIPWVLAEGVATTGAILWFLTGDAVVLALTSGGSLTVLIANRPGRMY